MWFLALVVFGAIECPRFQTCISVKVLHVGLSLEDSIHVIMKYNRILDVIHIQAEAFPPDVVKCYLIVRRPLPGSAFTEEKLLQMRWLEPFVLSSDQELIEEQVGHFCNWVPPAEPRVVALLILNQEYAQNQVDILFKLGKVVR